MCVCLVQNSVPADDSSDCSSLRLVIDEDRPAGKSASETHTPVQERKIEEDVVAGSEDDDDLEGSPYKRLLLLANCATSNRAEAVTTGQQPPPVGQSTTSDTRQEDGMANAGNDVETASASSSVVVHHDSPTAEDADEGDGTSPGTPQSPVSPSLPNNAHLWPAGHGHHLPSASTNSAAHTPDSSMPSLRGTPASVAMTTVTASSSSSGQPVRQTEAGGTTGTDAAAPSVSSVDHVAVSPSVAASARRDQTSPAVGTVAAPVYHPPVVQAGFQTANLAGAHDLYRKRAELQSAPDHSESAHPYALHQRPSSHGMPNMVPDASAISRKQDLIVPRLLSSSMARPTLGAEMYHPDAHRYQSPTSGLRPVSDVGTMSSTATARTQADRSSSWHSSSPPPPIALTQRSRSQMPKLSGQPPPSGKVHVIVFSLHI